MVKVNNMKYIDIEQDTLIVAVVAEHFVLLSTNGRTQGGRGLVMEERVEEAQVPQQVPLVPEVQGHLEGLGGLEVPLVP